MRMTHRLFLRLCWALCVVAAIPLVAHLLRADAAPRCAFDGQVLDPNAVSRIRFAAPNTQVTAAFCSISCASRWTLESDDRVRTNIARIEVPDADTGAALDARDAVFVRSALPGATVVLTPMHAFATQVAAERHAAQHRGVILRHTRHPFYPVATTSASSASSSDLSSAPPLVHENDELKDPRK